MDRFARRQFWPGLSSLQRPIKVTELDNSINNKDIAGTNVPVNNLFGSEIFAGLCRHSQNFKR